MEKINFYEVIDSIIKGSSDEQLINKLEIIKGKFERLENRERFLCALEAAGVDNWNGYGLAYEILDEWDSEDNVEN